MNDQDELLRHYEQELTHLRKMGAEFAQRYPKVAERLELSPDHCADPYVERLIESFAYLTARIRNSIEGHFPEIPAALLEVLHPHYLSPIPSMAVAQFDVDPTQGKLTSGFVIPEHTPLLAESHQGHTFRFRTCYPVTLWPVEITWAGFEGNDRLDDLLEGKTASRFAIRIRIEASRNSLSELDIKSLRLHLHGEVMLVHALYEILFSHVTQVAILPEGSRRPVYLPNDSLRPVGFSDGEHLLPAPNHSLGQYRLLQEYFAFPSKFLFFDIDGLERHASDRSFDILLFLDRPPKNHIAIGRDNFRLGCTPVINLFPKISEPIRLTHLQSEYDLVADKRREATTEIHSVHSVSSSRTDGDDALQLEPYYSFNHQTEERRDRVYWYARRTPSQRKDMPGTSMALSIVDLDFSPSLPAMQTIFARTLCTNRHSASQIPSGAELFVEDAAPISQVSLISKPTRQIDPSFHGDTYWRLVSHLSLNFLSLSNNSASLTGLREILGLYSYIDDASRQQQIMGITGMQCRRVTRRLGRDAWRGFCQGTEVTLEFDDTKYVGTSSFLLASVLNHFLPLHASINSFTQLNARSIQRERIWKQWPPMVGEQHML